jgi:hypothetical protein
MHVQVHSLWYTPRTRRRYNSATQRQAPAVWRYPMRISRPLRRLRSRVTRVSSLMSSSQLRASRPSRRALMDWSAQTAVGHDPTVQQPAAETQSGSPGEKYSGHRLRWQWRPWVRSTDSATTDPPGQSLTGHHDHPRCHTAAGTPAPAPSPERTTTNGPAPATRIRVVLLPHTRTEPTDTEPTTTPQLGEIT